MRIETAVTHLQTLVKAHEMGIQCLLGTADVAAIRCLFDVLEPEITALRIREECIGLENLDEDEVTGRFEKEDSTRLLVSALDTRRDP
jgi:hypothetical protein